MNPRPHPPAPVPPAPVALVTGASSGIGREIARELARLGARLVLVARREAALDGLAQELRAGGSEVTVLPADLSAPDAAARLVAELESRQLKIDLLVNNAGTGLYGELWTQDPHELRQLLTLNMVTLTELTRLLLPGMLERGRGRVLNVASIAAFMPGPLMAAYYASKAYVLSFSEALAEELRSSPVRVTALCPGPTHTGFRQAAHMEKSRMLRGTSLLERLGTLPPEQVARLGVNAMVRGQPVVVAGRLHQVQALAPRWLPRRLMPRLVARIQGRD